MRNFDVLALSDHARQVRFMVKKLQAFRTYALDAFWSILRTCNFTFLHEGDHKDHPYEFLNFLLLR